MDKACFHLNLTNTQALFEVSRTLNNFTFNVGSQTILSTNTNELDERLIPDVNSANFGYFGILDYERNNTGFNVGVRYDIKEMSLMTCS